MGSDGTPPKLSLFISRPTKPPEMPTPPLHTAVSVPFQWEEAPGKPRHRPVVESKPKSARALELPPRLLFSEAKVSNVPSPTTVLDGPTVGRAMSFTSSSGSASKDYWNVNFGSGRWRSFIRSRNSREKQEEDEAVEGGFDFPSCTIDGRCCDGSTTKVKIPRVRNISRRRSFFGNISNTRSHFWASIYDSLKRGVPWRRKQDSQ